MGRAFERGAGVGKRLLRGAAASLKQCAHSPHCRGAQASASCCLPAPFRPVQRWDAHRKAAALAHWRRLLAERREAQESLKRCLTRKRVAFRLFRQWYWESFDEDMQVQPHTPGCPSPEEGLHQSRTQLQVEASLLAEALAC